MTTDDTVDLAQLACASANVRCWRHLGLFPPHQGDEWIIRKHPLIVASDRVRDTMALLGQQCQKNGTDLRDSHYYDLLEFRDIYEEHYEEGRIVVLHELSPKAIYRGIAVHNVLKWGEWTIRVSEPDEMDDEYGLPCWGRYVLVERNGQTIESLPLVNRNNARSAYRTITGHSFEGKCDLGFDRPHFYDNIPSWR